jgi:hypothetical protein
MGGCATLGEVLGQLSQNGLPFRAKGCCSSMLHGSPPSAPQWKIYFLVVRDEISQEPLTDDDDHLTGKSPSPMPGHKIYDRERYHHGCRRDPPFRSRPPIIRAITLNVTALCEPPIIRNKIGQQQLQNDGDQRREKLTAYERPVATCGPCRQPADARGNACNPPRPGWAPAPGLRLILRLRRTSPGTGYVGGHDAIMSWW